jgi:23S rRNA pseudouridine1911/1915/1917 synthase
MRVEGRGRDYGVIHFLVETQENLVEYVAREAALDATRVLEILELGAIYVDEQRARRDLLLAIGARVRVHSEPRRYVIPDSQIIFRNSDYLILDKPSGVPVHAFTDNCQENLLARLELDLGRQVFITHRLDVETSGLLVVALNEQSQRDINRGIAEKSIKRIYTALVESELEVGEYVHFMERSQTAPKKVRRTAQMGWQECRLRVLQCTENSRPHLGAAEFPSPNFALRIELLTGRTQQIRAQLAALERPILGDVLYGGKVGSTPKAIALRASSIEIDGLIHSVP